MEPVFAQSSAPGRVSWTVGGDFIDVALEAITGWGYWVKRIEIPDTVPQSFMPKSEGD